MKTEEKLNMTMLCDFYELTMGNGYFESGYKDHITYFDVFFRRVPDGGGFAIAAGLEQLIDYIENLHFSPEDIAYLRGRNLFSEEFLSYLRGLPFHRRHLRHAGGNAGVSPRAHGHRPGPGHRGPAHRDLHAADHQPPEPDRHQGQPHRPCRPVAARCWSSAPAGPRGRMPPSSAPVPPTSAAVAGTACTISDQIYGVPAGGTMAHAWVQMFDSASMTPSRPTARSIPTTPRCWWIPTIP